MDEILKKRSLQLNRLVWEALFQDGLTDDVLSAEYSVNNRLVVNRCDSSLVKILRKRTWVPGKDKAVCSLDDIWAIDFKILFSYDSRIMSNMCLISSSTFVAANIGPAVVHTFKTLVIDKNKDKEARKQALDDILTHVNIAGIGRAILAFSDNSKYFNENIHLLFNNLKWNRFKARRCVTGTYLLTHFAPKYVRRYVPVTHS